MGVTLDLTWAKGGRHPLQIKGSPGDRIQSACVGITFDSSYPTGGESLADLLKLFKTLLGIWPMPTPTYEFAWDQSSSSPLLLAYVRATGAQVANTTDLSAVTTKLWVIGQE